MQLNKIKLQNFRNYEDFELSFSDNATIIAGENAQGKTNLLEAIFLLTGEKSWRIQKKAELISFGFANSVIEAEVISRSRKFHIKMPFCENARTKNIINGVPQKNQEALSDIFKCVLFSPDDLYLIKNGPAARRKFIDIAISQLRPRYYEALREYNRLLEHKTKLLKTYRENPTLLDILPDFTLQMAKYGAAIIKYRAYFIKKLGDHAKSIHANIAAGESLAISYKTVSNVTEIYSDEKTIEHALLDHAQSHYDAELACGNCLSGPHKDDIYIEINGKNARNFASQGQTRTAALALKFAEREIMFSDCGEYPLMLLDDVLSELDAKRQEFLLNSAGGGQVIITCCEKSEKLELLDAKTVFIKNGRVC